ncbi:MAG: malate/lactate/ureidoglycolate dehydrogenase [Alphaproteobacteria bacterium]|nr:malate/lactate/ureidoglycolate dehydrogenase [Alphaproteobacteria bacterium]
MLIAVDRLIEFAEAVVQRGGGSQEAAAQVARTLVEANLTGHDSHGVGMLPAYVNGIKAGQLIPDASAEIIQEKGPFLLVDGHQGFGQVIARQATQWAIERVRQKHIAVLSLRNSFHLGRLADWGIMAAEAGFISIQFANVLSPNSLVAPHGGRESRFTTNPYCTVVPATDRHPLFVLDMATSTIAQGKARVAYLKGGEVPDGSLIDHDGNPTNDPKVIFDEPLGAMRTMGLHKGYGLSLICDLLGGAFSGGGAYLPERVIDARIINNMMMILIDPDVFGSAEAFFGDVDNYTDWVKSAAPAPGFESVMFPGDPERKTRLERSSNGIPIDDGSWQQLLETAGSVGLSEAEINKIVGS